MPTNQPSEKQRAASRANGAKSAGPATPEGRARSSRNSLRHGLSSETHTQLAVENMVLPHEDRAQFESLRASYIHSFQPANQPQHDLVETMAAARWRLNRLQHIETKLFEKEMVLHADEIEKELANMTEVEKLACVFDRMANQGKSVALLIRYEGSLNRTYERAFKQLQQLQRQPAQSSAGASEKIPNEPEPAPAPPLAAPQTSAQSTSNPAPQPPPAPRSALPTPVPEPIPTRP